MLFIFFHSCTLLLKQFTVSLLSMLSFKQYYFACLVKISADNILKYFFTFPGKNDPTPPLEMSSIKCQIRFPKKNIISLPSAESVLMP